MKAEKIDLQINDNNDWIIWGRLVTFTKPSNKHVDNLCTKHPLCIRYESLKLMTIHILVLCNSLADKSPTFQRNIVPLFSIWQAVSSFIQKPVPIYKITGQQNPNTQYSESHKSNMVCITVQFTFNSDKWKASEQTCHSPQYHVTTLFPPDYLGLPRGDGIQHLLLLQPRLHLGLDQLIRDGIQSCCSGTNCCCYCCCY